MVKSFGGWTKFMETYNMKPHDQVDMWEAKRMVEKMALDSANPVVGQMSTKEEDSQGTYRSSLSSQSELSMSATIAGPELSERARGIIKSFGGWEKFMQTYGLKPHDQVDGWEAKRIIERMAQEDSTTSAPIEGSSKDNLGTHRPSLLVQPANPTFVDPHLTDAGRGIIKSFGGWDKFMQTYGLRPNNPVDMWEAKRIVERMAQEDTSTPNVVDSSTTKDSIGAFPPLLIVAIRAESSLVDPHLSETGRGIIKSFGGWEKFMQTYGLNPHNQVDVWEAKRIIERMALEEPSTSSGDNTKDSLGTPFPSPSPHRPNDL